MATYEQQPSYPAPPHTRSRQSSTASQCYVPETYLPPSERAPLPVQGYPYVYGKPAPPPTSMVPLHPKDSYGLSSGQSVPPETLLQPTGAAYPPLAAVGNSPYPASAPVQQLPANIMSARRHSYDSRHSPDSHRSHESRRSRDSHRSRKSHHSRRHDDDHESDRRHRHHDEKDRGHKRDKDYGRHSKRADMHKPTIGDTLFALWDGVKSALSSRHQY